MNKELLKNLLTYTLMNAIQDVKYEYNQLIYSHVNIRKDGDKVVVNDEYEVGDKTICKLYDTVVEFLKQKNELENNIDDKLVKSFGDKSMYAYNKISLDWLEEE